MRTTGHGADEPSSAAHRRPMTGDVTRCGLEADDRPLGPVGLDVRESVSPDESALVEPHCPPEPCLIWVHGFVHVTAIQAECRLEAGGIASPKPGGKDARMRALLEYRVPDVPHSIG